MRPASWRWGYQDCGQTEIGMQDRRTSWLCMWWTGGCKREHSLSCKHGSGRLARHHSINDLIHRALIRANIPLIKEPKGLLRTDNKRPDGFTLIPWQAGRNLTWGRVDCQHCCSIVHSNHVCDCGRCHGDRVRAQDREVCGALEYILFLSNNFRDVWPNQRSRPLLPGRTRSPNSWLHWGCKGNRTSTSAYFGDHPTVQFHFVSWQLCCYIMWETTLVVLSRIPPST